MRKAVFIDKDGTLIPDVPFNIDPALISLLPNNTGGLRQLQENGYLLIIISNQAGVARGLFRTESLAGVKEKITELLKAEGVELDGFYFCPHHPEGIVEEFSVECECRKPKPGLILKAAADFDIDLGSSWMIGDILHDIEAGKRAGCRAILVNNGNETEWELNAYRIPDFLVQNMDEAATLILGSAAPAN